MSWNNYVSSLQELEAYQKKIRKSYAKDRKTYLKGEEDPGAPYTKKPPKTRSKSAPGPYGAIGEEVEEESFETQETLQPDIWEHNVLRPDIRERLIEIAKGFLNSLNTGVEMQDLRFTGSLANYNWSQYSDVDLHLIVDFAEVDENEALVKSFFDNARMRWNDTHDIKMHGFEVEIYVENVKDVHHSGGLYSILKDEWVAEPFPYEGDIDFATARKKSDDITTQVNLIAHVVDSGKFEAALKSIARLKEKVSNMRKSGLATPEREYSPENIAFKILRRDNVLKKLNILKQQAYNQEMSMR